MTVLATQLLFWGSLSLTTGVPNSDPCPGVPDGTPIATVEWTGLETTQPDVVERHLRHQPGLPFSCGGWILEKAALENLDVFATVDLVIRSTPKGLALTYTFEELPPFMAFPAIKATDQQGWAGGGGLSMLNLFGRDVRLDFYVRTTLSPELFRATEYMVYSESPRMGSLPLEWDLVLVVTDSANPLLRFDERSFLAELRLLHPTGLGAWKGLFGAALFTVAHDPQMTEFAPGDGRTHPLFLSTTDRDWVPRVGLGLVRDTREKAYNPHFGGYVEFSVTQFGGLLGGPANYLEFLGDLRAFIPVYEQDVLAVSSLGRYRPGTMGAYDFLHVGGANTARIHGARPEYYGHHEVLNTVEYRRSFFERESFGFFGSTLYFGLQWVVGVDGAVQWRTEDGDPALLSSLYTGPHVLFPGFDRFRIEFGISQFHEARERWGYGLSLGLFEKAYMQRQRVR